jgi:hypothetical protein
VSERGWPREVVISRGYGAGLATWWDDAYEIVEHPAVVAAAKEGVPWEEAQRRITAAGFDADNLYGGGWDNAVVVEVSGPYVIREYDGSESIVRRDAVDWRL